MWSDALNGINITLPEMNPITLNLNSTQTRDLSLSTKVSEDGSSLEERQAFLLQLAQDLPPAPAPEVGHENRIKMNANADI